MNYKHPNLGNFGGLLGLCLGFSLVNIIEIIYFATVRLYRNISVAMKTKTHQNVDQTFHLSKEDKQIREMYVNDFKKYDNKMFHTRT